VQPGVRLNSKTSDQRIEHVVKILNEKKKLTESEEIKGYRIYLGAFDLHKQLMSQRLFYS
jgi:hypothetical protein